MAYLVNIILYNSTTFMIYILDEEGEPMKDLDGELLTYENEYD